MSGLLAIALLLSFHPSITMPTYEYECSEGHRFEVLQKMSDEAVSACIECGAPAQRKISGGAGFLFKGEGFYITDARSDEYKKKAKADAPPSSSDSSKSSKSDGKSASGASGSESTKTSSDS